MAKAKEEVKNDAIALKKDLVGNISISEAFDSIDTNDFEDTGIQLLSAEELQSMQDVQLRMVATKMFEITVQDEIVDVVELHMLTEEGLTKRLASQYKFKQAFKQFNPSENEAVLMLVTFKGKVKINGSNKTVNDIEILGKKIKTS